MRQQQKQEHQGLATEAAASAGAAGAGPGSPALTSPHTHPCTPAQTHPCTPFTQASECNLQPFATPHPTPIQRSCSDLLCGEVCGVHTPRVRSKGLALPVVAVLQAGQGGGTVAAAAPWEGFLNPRLRAYLFLSFSHKSSSVLQGQTEERT